MKQYPHIVGSSKAPREHCMAFYKYDGSNVRFEWSKKRGWYKFGTRTQLIDETVEIFGQAIPVFKNTLAEGIEKVLRDEYRDIQEAVAFGEFFGSNSFAGVHLKEDPKEVVLFDVSLYKKGFLGPRDFHRNFGHLKSADLIYEGNLNDQFVNDVRNGKYPVREGVVCKGGSGHGLWMCKIKTLKYKEELTKRFQGDWQKFWE